MSFGFGFGFTKIAAAIRAAFSPSSLFAANEPGVWYDPSDLSTLYQDSAGTTPVTAVEQPVGLMLDKSGNGNHAYQTTTTSRPVLSARYNLLTKTEQFDGVEWKKTGLNAFGSGSVSNTTATTDPLGGNTADFIQESVSTSAHEAYFNKTEISGPLLNYTYSIRVKPAGRAAFNVSLTGFTGNNYVAVLFDLSSTGSVSKVTQIGLTTHLSSSIDSIGNGWFLCVITVNSPDVRYIFNGMCNNLTPSYDSLGRPSYAGDGTSGIYIWGASLVPANQAHLPYQRVNTATDYDTTGFPHYLRFDGVDDWLVTNTITPGIDKAQVFAGVRRLTDTAGVICELSSDWNAFTGSFLFWGGNNANGVGAGFNSASRGSIGASTPHFGYTQYVFTPPVTAVVSAIHDIDNDLTSVRGNGAAGVNGTGYKGTGNFLAYPLYIGRRGGTSLPFNGHLYSLIVRFGSNLPIETLKNTEKYINTKTGAY